MTAQVEVKRGESHLLIANILNENDDSCSLFGPVVVALNN